MRSNLSKEELQALHNLRNQKHLAIQKADKGNTVVITEKLFLILPSLSNKYRARQTT